MSEQCKKEFLFNAPISGYSRGYAALRIEADSEEVARKMLDDHDYEIVEIMVIRDDRELELDEAELIKEND